VESSCECGNEPLDSIKCWEIIKWLHNWWPLSSIELVSYYRNNGTYRPVLCNLLDHCFKIFRQFIDWIVAVREEMRTPTGQ
jgi:hypothetical protein